MNLPQSLLRLFVSGYIFTICFISFNFNVFNVIPSDSLKTFDSVSEILIIDGLRHSKQHPFSLGVTPQTNRQYLDAVNTKALSKVEFYNGILNNNESIEGFNEYRSQYGLQGKLFHWLFQLKASYTFLKTFVVLFFCALMLVIIRGLYSYFSISSIAITFTLLAVSPWLVKSIDNLYWVEFKFLLIVIATYISAPYLLYPNLSRNSLLSYLLVILVFIFYFLNGFEYTSSAGVLSIIPVIFYMSLKSIPINKVFISTGIIFLLFIVAFVIATIISSQSGANVKDIMVKRGVISSENTTEILASTCQNLSAETDNQACVEKYSVLLNAKRSSVMARYLLVDIFPLGKHTISDDNPLRKSLKLFITSPSLANILLLLNDLNIEVVFYLLSKIFFVPLFLYFLITLILGKWTTYASAIIVLSALVPISWILLAIGHAAAHFHINYILWYFPFIPISFLLLLNKKQYWKTSLYQSKLVT